MTLFFYEYRHRELKNQYLKTGSHENNPPSRRIDPHKTASLGSDLSELDSGFGVASHLPQDLFGFIPVNELLFSFCNRFFRGF